MTLVLNFSEGPWKGPRSLLDMAEYRDAELNQVAEQSRLLIVDPFTMDDKMLDRFCTDLKFMLCCWRLSRDDEALQAFLESQKGQVFPSLEMRRTLYMFCNIEFDEAVDDTEGGIGVMCEAIRKMVAKGRKEGIDEGIEKGRKEGREEERYKLVVNALQMKVDFDMIHKLTGLSLESIRNIAQSIAML